MKASRKQILPGRLELNNSLSNPITALSCLAGCTIFARLAAEAGLFSDMGWWGKKGWNFAIDFPGEGSGSTYLLWGIDDTSVVSELEGAQHCSSHSQHQASCHLPENRGKGLNLGSPQPCLPHLSDTRALHGMLGRQQVQIFRIKEKTHFFGSNREK